ncbi:Polyadenylate-binding protein 5 [Platanthera zijinensis]|uniref:Polyadenylate-binding protein 5 n=1 Tax=Platanthera zijinensis TaxID=2320716 RepID=A0AAP0BMW7_9ASPA
MPPRSAKKSPAKKPTPRANKTAPSSDPSPVDALPLVAEGKAIQLDAVSDAALAKVEAVSSPTVVEEDTTVDDAENIGEPAQSESEDSLEPKGDGSEGSEEGSQDQEADEHDEVDDTVVKLEVDGDDADDVDDNDDEISDADVDNEEKHDNDHSLSIVEGKKQEPEVFVGGLDKEAVEDDLIEVFGVFGDIQSVRIVRHPVTKKSKGFAFIRFANGEHTMKALTALKDGTEIKGKHVRVQASQDNATLYLGNISKTWTRDNVIKKLKELGIEQFDNLNLPKDSKDEEKIMGFAFLEFSSHADAMVAFQRLRKVDADFGRDKTAKVAFSNNSLQPNDESLLQVKTVFIEGIPLSWDEEKVKEICKEHGQIENVSLSRNFNSNKRKDFGFVEFSSRESALACVEGINKAQIVDGDVKVSANIARPLSKKRSSKQVSKGGFRVNKDGETIQESARVERKRKNRPEERKHNAGNARSKPSHIRDSKGKSELQTTPMKRKKMVGKDTNTDTNRRPAKKMRPNHNDGKAYGRHSDGYGGRKSSYSSNPGTRFGARTAAYPATRYRGYAHAEASEPRVRPSDLVPHAGYLPALKPATSNYEYDRKRSGTYNSEVRSSFGSGRAISGIPPSYRSHTDYSSYQPTGYGPPSSVAYAPRGPQGSYY